jgi:hypothetical protein
VAGRRFEANEPRNRVVPIPVTVPSLAVVFQVPPPVTSSSPIVKVPEPATVIMEKSLASADPVPPGLTVVAIPVTLNLTMSYR